MKTRKLFGATLLLSVMLVSCWQQSSTPPVPPPPQKKTNVYEIQFKDVGDKTLKSSVTGFKATDKGIQKTDLTGVSDNLGFQFLSGEVFTVETAGERYVKVRYKVTNNTGKAVQNLTFLPFDTDDADADTSNNADVPTIGDTAFKYVQLFDGSQAPSLASIMVTGRGQSYDVDTDAAITDASATPYLTGLDPSGITPSVPAGLVSGGIMPEGWQKSGIIPIGGTATFTFSVKHPIQSPRKNNPYAFSIMVVYAESPSMAGITRIHDIQGATASGDAVSSLAGNTVTIDGIVTTDLQQASELGGFYLQEETADQDSDPTTSEGIFVKCDTTCLTVNKGDRVRLTAEVAEVSTETRLITVSNPIVMATGQTLPAAASVTLSATPTNWEQYEGMLVSTTGTVSDNSQLGRGGLVTITDLNTLPAFTQENTPGAAGFATYETEAAARTVIVDDGSLTEHPSSIIFGRGNNPLTAGNTLRNGDGATVTGVVGYSGSGWTGTDAYRLHASAASATFTGGGRGPAPTDADLNNPQLKVATFDLNGFFNGDGAGSNFTTEGASDAAELTRQQDKLVEALQDLDADVIALQGLENDYAESIPAIKTLVNALNAALGSTVYTYINPGSNLGTQSTAVGLIYRTAAVTPVGSFSVLDNTDNATYNDVRNHPALAQTFRTAGLGTFTAVAVDLEDRLATCGAGDDDTTTGQGNCSKTRNDAATVLMDWVNSDPTGSGDTDVVLLGGFNAFMQEDPINTVLNGADDTNGTGDDFIQLFDTNDYTAVVNGRRGTLDYALVSSSLQAQLKGAGIWHINAAEPSVLDYNTENKTAAQQTDLYDTNPYRSSAHDPVIIGLTLDATNVNPTDITLTPSSIAENNTAGATVGTLGASDPNSGDTFTFTLVNGSGNLDNGDFTISDNTLKINDPVNFEGRGSFSIRVRATDQGGLTYEEALTITVTDVNEAPTTLSLTGGTINENLAAGASAGTLSTNDPDAGDTITYSLVTGTGDTDNASFTIVGDDLRNTAAFDFETKSSYSIRVRATDSASHSVEQQFTITVNDVVENGAPTDITLAPSSIAENNASGATVGALTAVDPNAGDIFTFTLVSGAGDTDNGDFTISGSSLKLTPSANFEAKSSYSVRIHVEDQNGAAFEKALTVSITNVNEAPTDISLSNDSVAENSAGGSLIGNLSTTDPDTGNTFTYSLVTGTGDTDNASFTLASGGALTINSSPNFEVKNSYSIRVQVNDGVNTFEKSFTINVTNVNEAPTVLSLTGNSVAENQPSGTAVGSFSTTDPDASDTFTYTLVTGSGDTDNSSFQIVGGQLQTNAVFNFENKNSYSIRVRTTDAGGLFTEQSFTINVTNVNETPTDIALSATSVDENVAGNTVVGTLSSTDVDAGDTFTYTLVTGSGDTDNGSFNISGNSLRITNSPNFETKSSYTVRIRTTDAGGLFFEKAFTITINDLNETPIASNDSGLKALGNTTLEVNKSSTAALKVSHDSVSFDLLDNDSDPDTNPAFANPTVTGVSGVTTGASVSFDSNGTFHYTPKPGFTGTDTFTYTITDAGGLSANGTVSIDVQGQIWYVKNDTGSAGTGTSLSPYNQLSSAVSSAQTGDTIYVFTGNGSNTNMTSGFALKTNQKLIGEGSALALSDITVPGSHNALSFNGRSAGTAPLISNTSGDGVSGSNVGTVVVKGLSITGSTNGVNINNSSGTHSVTLNNLTVAGATQAVALGNSSTATTTAALNNLTLNASSGTGLSLSKTAGTFNISAFDDILVSGNTTGTGINASNVNFSSITGATVAVGTSGNGTGTNGVLLDGSTGSLSFDSLNVYNDNGTGLKANNSGLTLTVTGGNVESTNGPAVDISNAPSNLTFTTVKSTNSTATGVSLSAGSTSTSMAFSAGSGSAIAGADGHAFYVNSGTGNITYNGTISKTDGTGTNAVRITSRNSGSASTIAFTGSITDGVADTNGGIYLDDNDQATINFSGQITASTTTQPAFTATNGGTVSASDTTSTLTTSSGIPLNVQNTTIGSNNLRFRSISSNGATNGIYLLNTGSSGGLKVLGNSTTGTGGTIQNIPSATDGTTGGIGAYLNNTQNVQLDYMNFNSSPNFGIYGTNVVNFSMNGVQATGTHGTTDAADEAVMAFDNLTGTASVSNSTFSGGVEDNVRVKNTSGTLNRITFNTVTIGLNSTSLGNDGILIEPANSAVANITIQNSTFQGARGDMLQVNVINNASSDLILSNNTFNNVHSNIVSGGGGLTLGGGGTGSNPTFTYNITGNSIQGALGTALLLNKGSGTGNFSGTISGNFIGAAGTTDSGSKQGSALSVIQTGGGTITTTISNNQLRQYNNYGIYLQAGVNASGGNGTFNATITSNTVANPGSNTGLFIINGLHANIGTTTADAHQACLKISGNTLTGSGSGGGTEYRLRQRFNTTIRLPGYSGGNTDSTAIVNFINSNNTTTSGSTATSVAGGGGGFTGTGSTCP